MNNSEFHAGDYDAVIPGVYGEPNLSSDESSREIIPLLQKLIKVIEETGALPEWTSMQAATGIKALPGAIQTAQGSFATGPIKPLVSGSAGLSQAGTSSQFPNLFDQKYKGGMSSEMLLEFLDFFQNVFVAIFIPCFHGICKLSLQKTINVHHARTLHLTSDKRNETRFPSLQ